MAERGGLENRCGPMDHRGFESLPLRQIKTLFGLDYPSKVFCYRQRGRLPAGCLKMHGLILYNTPKNQPLD